MSRKHNRNHEPKEESKPVEEEISIKDEEEDVEDEDDDNEEIINASDEDLDEDDVEDDGEDDDDEIDALAPDMDLLDEVQKDFSKGTEFYSDSEEEEWDDKTKNRVGRIPMEFYNDYDHIGYNLDGEKIAKPVEKKQGEIDKFLAQQEDPNYWRTVRDVVNQRDVVLSPDEYNLVRNIMNGRLPSGADPYEDWVELPFADGIHPLKNLPIRKASFIPKRWEAAKIRKLAHAIHHGWIKIKTDAELQEEREKKHDYSSKPFLIWDQQEEEPNEWLPSYLRPHKYVRPTQPAPKAALPVHTESYNPPAEYLFDDQEKQDWEDEEPHKRKIDYIPQKFNSMRSIPAYPQYVKERFNRCLDIVVAPRMAIKEKPKRELVIPNLPAKQNLKPYPTMENLVYNGHTERIRSISVDTTGQWLASGSDDGTIRVWEVDTARCIKVINIGEVVYCVTWNPDPTKCILAASIEGNTLIVNPGIGSEAMNDSTNEFMKRGQSVPPHERLDYKQWDAPSEDLIEKGIIFKIPQAGNPKVLNWHSRGDYLITVCPEANSTQNSLVIHQMTRYKSQSPLKHQKGKIQYARFHPTKPLLFIATQTHIKKYNLAEMKLEQKLESIAKWVSSFDIHPGGDNLVLGTYDRKVSWFDMDLSTRPYRTLTYHKQAVRKVVYHKKYPMFASCSDDLTLQIFHGMVHTDLLQNALIVPLKALKGHKSVDDLGILDCTFHPTQPWIFSAGADATIRLYT